MTPFIHDPTKMARFVKKDDLKIIGKNIPINKFWETKYKYTKETITNFHKEMKGGAIRNVHYYGQGVGGVLGIKYEEFTK